jgi:heme/copper-type cytochrome/quinol oxidase subunit 2
MRLFFADGLFWTSVACCAIAQLLIIRSVLGTRPVPETAASLPRQRGGVELFWTVVPAIALTVVLVFTWRAVRETRPAVAHPVAIGSAAR